MRSFKDYVERKKKDHVNFDPSDLNPAFIPYYENQKRIEVEFCFANGKVYETKRGRVGVTTGWKPIFILLPNMKSVSSCWTIGKNDKIVKEVSK